MQRTPINPHSWTVQLGFDQAELIEEHQRMLVCSGQDAVDADGKPQHPGDMSAQLKLALDDLEAILEAADVTLANIVRLNVYTTDVDEVIKQFHTLNDPFWEQSLCDLRPRRRKPSHPAQFLAMLEATAVD